MTKYLDELRKSRDPKLGDWVFINTLNEPYTPSTTDVATVLLVRLILLFTLAAWTSFVKACFGKHSLSSTGQRKAPSASLTRSIFVTWLNGVPYDAHDSPFLQEIKVSAAEYQTHSLAIANRHYDKDVASELRLRELVDFCDKYSAWSVLHPVAAASGQLGRLSVRDDNVDSDDEGFESVAPLPRAARPKPVLVAGSGSASSAIDLTFETKEGKESKEPKETKEARAQAAAAGRARLVQDDNFDDDEGFGPLEDNGSQDAEGKAEEDEPLYMPEHIIAKKTVRWKNYYLVHWRGFSESERTWEPAEHYDEYCLRKRTRTTRSGFPSRSCLSELGQSTARGLVLARVPGLLLDLVRALALARVRALQAQVSAIPCITRFSGKGNVKRAWSCSRTFKVWRRGLACSRSGKRVNHSAFLASSRSRTTPKARLLKTRQTSSNPGAGACEGWSRNPRPRLLFVSGCACM